MRHVATASLAVDLKSHIIIVAGELRCSGRCIELAFTLLGTRNDITEILRVLPLIGLGRINRVTKQPLVGSVHC